MSTTVREELVNFVYSSLDKLDSKKLNDKGFVFVDAVLTQLKSDKFLDNMLGKKFAGFDHTLIPPVIQSDMKIIVEKVLRLIITEVILEE